MLLFIAAACTGGDPGFAGGGSYVAPPVDTGPETDTDTDTDADTDTDTDADADTDTDTDTDTGPRIPGGDDCGVGLDKVACDLILVDGSGNSWSLWDQYGQPVALVVGKEYDQHFVSASIWLQDVADKRSGAVVGSVMIEDINLSAADDEDAARWTTTHGIELSLADPEGNAEDGQFYGSQTTTYVIDEDMVIRSVIYGFVGESQLNDKLKEL